MAVHWSVKHCDILVEPADVLICPANPWLNLSGGIGGEILLRHGPAMQQELHEYLANRGLRSIPQGEVVACGPGGTSFQAVLHAVAIDCFYSCSAEDITSVVVRALSMAASLGAAKAALAALGTGYGRLSITDFARGLLPILALEFAPLTEVVICLRKRDDVEELSAALDQGALT
jgi:O-acetyl-ADP-ribose deacetylase